jgi:hypothetical protein
MEMDVVLVFDYVETNAAAVVVVEYKEVVVVVERKEVVVVVERKEVVVVVERKVVVVVVECESMAIAAVVESETSVVVVAASDTLRNCMQLLVHMYLAQMNVACMHCYAIDDSHVQMDSGIQDPLLMIDRMDPERTHLI